MANLLLLEALLGGQAEPQASVIARLSLRAAMAAAVQPDINAAPVARMMMRSSTVGQAVIGDVITLSGTSGTPISNGVSGEFAQAGWEFRTNGTVWKLISPGSDAQYQDGTEWNGSQDSPTADYYIRFTQQSFSGDGNYVGSSTFNTWHKLSGTGAATRRFEIDDPPGTGATVATVKVEIASDASPIGSVIEATGYYRATAEDDVTPP